MQEEWSIQVKVNICDRDGWISAQSMDDLCISEDTTEAAIKKRSFSVKFLPISGR